MLAFKIMNDPFVGSLTFCRIYSGKLDQGHRRSTNTVKEKRERIGRMLQMHCQLARRHRRGLCRRHRCAGRPQGNHHRRHALRSAEAGHSGAHGIPRAGHPDRHRAEDQGRPGKDGPRAQPPGCRRSVLPRQDRRRIRPDDHRRHGRTAPRHHRRPHAPRVQGRGQCRRAAGCLSRDDHARCTKHDYTHKKQTGGSGQFARVKIVFEPNPESEDFKFESKIVGGSVPKEYIPGVQKGIESVMTSVRSPASRCSASRRR